jgi:demethylmenaquinone methyltransferase / 2-methoxy-6-polyprenyl-1,4-benzoquinol methylase
LETVKYVFQLQEFVGKEKQVEAMFNQIASRYDFLNRLLSLGIDKLWRRRLVKGLLKSNPELVLDVATGTADLAIALAKKSSKVMVTGVDIAEGMLLVGNQKIIKYDLSHRIKLVKASSEKLPFPDKMFDSAMVAFGVRNFENPLNGLKEMFRVLKPNGTIHVLEFTIPRYRLVAYFYKFYFTKLLPWVGRRISGHPTAYTYLPESVGAFYEREGFINLMHEAGFAEARYKLQSFGIAAIYSASKLNES